MNKNFLLMINLLSIVSFSILIYLKMKPQKDIVSIYEDYCRPKHISKAYVSPIQGLVVHCFDNASFSCSYDFNSNKTDCTTSFSDFFYVDGKEAEIIYSKISQHLDSKNL